MKNTTMLNETKSLIITFPLERGMNFNPQVEEFLENIGFTLDGFGLGSIEFKGNGNLTEIDGILQAKFGKNLFYDFILD